MTVRVIIFLVLNFSALALGGLFTGKGVPSDWYMQLNKAPWTPPGWVFGTAWTTIMICFSFYLAFLWPLVENKSFLIGLYLVQWILNVAWNPTFFYFQNIFGGLMIISILTLTVGYFLFRYAPELRYKSILILPYFV